MIRGDGTYGNVTSGRTHSDSGRNGKLETLSAADLMALDLLPATQVCRASCTWASRYLPGNRR